MSSLKTSLQHFLQQTCRNHYLRQLRKSREEYAGRVCADDATVCIKLQTPAFCYGESPAERQAVVVSMIIPSKDNPEMLERCLRSICDTCMLFVQEEKDSCTQALQEKTPLGKRPETVDNQTAVILGLEVIIVDNGSNTENRLKINEIINNTFSGNSQIRTQYLYEQEDFNFSKMCNKGAAAATGDLLLFLNDDVETVTPGWLEAMAAGALATGVGAVGAKLLYPDEVMKKTGVKKDEARYIQHCGVVNTRVGPIHVFGRLPDDVSYADGYNKKCVPVIAVTGACLMMRKQLFDEIGGFSEELAVAFNDVDLCYTLVERGCTNLCMNEVTLMHYESFSRGDDSVHAEKRLRLLQEYRTLMSRHRALIGVDPFFPKTASTEEQNPFPSRAITDVFHPDTLQPSRLRRFKLPEGVREDRALFAVAEYSDKLWLWKCANETSVETETGIRAGTGEAGSCADDEALLIWGYTFVIGSDNALYKRTLMFKKVEPVGTEYKDVDDEILACPVHDAYRPDIQPRIPDQINAQMCGFYAKIDAKDLPPGAYNIGFLAEKAFSTEKLMFWGMSIVLRD